MADQHVPNSAAGKDKAEGERPTGGDRETDSGAGEQVGNRYDEHEAGDAGISNRPVDEEVSNQQSLPERGGRKGGTHA